MNIRYKYNDCKMSTGLKKYRAISLLLNLSIIIESIKTPAFNAPSILIIESPVINTANTNKSALSVSSLRLNSYAKYNITAIYSMKNAFAINHLDIRTNGIDVTSIKIETKVITYVFFLSSLVDA